MMWAMRLGAPIVCGALCCGCGRESDDASGGSTGTGGTDIPGHRPSAGRSCAADPRCGSESCCASLDVEGGELLMGRGTEDCGPPGCQTEWWNIACPLGYYCDSGDLPEHPMTVASFALDKYEVTVGRFRAFVEAYEGNTSTVPPAGAGAHELIEGSGWDPAFNARLPTDRALLRRRLACAPSTTRPTPASAARVRAARTPRIRSPSVPPLSRSPSSLPAPRRSTSRPDSPAKEA